MSHSKNSSSQNKNRWTFHNSDRKGNVKTLDWSLAQNYDLYAPEHSCFFQKIAFLCSIPIDWFHLRNLATTNHLSFNTHGEISLKKLSTNVTSFNTNAELSFKKLFHKLPTFNTNSQVSIPMERSYSRNFFTNVPSFKTNGKILRNFFTPVQSFNTNGKNLTKELFTNSQVSNTNGEIILKKLFHKHSKFQFQCKDLTNETFSQTT